MAPCDAAGMIAAGLHAALMHARQVRPVHIMQGISEWLDIRTSGKFCVFVRPFIDPQCVTFCGINKHSFAMVDIAWWSYLRCTVLITNRYRHHYQDLLPTTWQTTWQTTLQMTRRLPYERSKSMYRISSSLQRRLIPKKNPELK